MKKITLICLFLLVFIGLRAQSYIPFPSNMVIYSLSQMISSPWDPVTYTTYRVEITGDTLIGGNHYKKLYSGIGPYTVTAGIRNDTINKKVYMYSVSTGTEKLLYDFNLAVGDTVNKNDGYGFYQPIVATPFSSVPAAWVDTAWVTSIDSVLMLHDGLYHRRFNFSGTIKNIVPDSADVVISSNNPGPYYYSLAPGDAPLSITVQPLIEGVGQIYNPVSHFAYFEYYWDYGPLCASIQGVPVYSLGASYPPFVNPSLCNSIYLGVDEIKKEQDVWLYPNPTAGLFRLETEQELNSIEILDVFGKQLYYSEKNQTEINISDFVNGIYFVRLVDSNDNVVVKKVVKQ